MNEQQSWPGYVGLQRTGELARRAQQAQEHMAGCTICPRACGANRLRDERGECGTGRRAVVHSSGPHFGEEPPLVGRRGSGTIFFAHCNLKCVFCQNWEISHGGGGAEMEAEELARAMLHLQALGSHNVNLVSPSHVVPQVLAALVIAAEAGLRIPLVYNTGGYDSLPTLRLLDGVVDIYMPDMKYADAEVAERLSGIKEYPRVNQMAVRDMHRQVGDLVWDQRGVATRGLIVRHLVLPDGLAGTLSLARFIATHVSRDTYLNVMDQYRPAYLARRDPQIGRRIAGQEFADAIRAVQSAGLRLPTTLGDR